MFYPTVVRSTAFGAVAALACTVAGAETVDGSASSNSNVVGFVKQIEGSAMMSQGAKYVDATSGMKLYDLDRVMVLEFSSAALELADGCVYEIQASQMLTVQEGDTCESLAARANPQVDMSQIERGATSQIQPRGAETPTLSALAAKPAAAAPGESPGTLFVAGTAAMGLAIALLQRTGSGDRETSQPNLSP